jgi:hypothetical protein
MMVLLFLYSFIRLLNKDVFRVVLSIDHLFAIHILYQ